MRFFVCLLPCNGAPAGEAVRRRYETVAHRHSLDVHWQRMGTASIAIAGDDPSLDPMLACHGRHIAVGTARLDNRTEIARLASVAPEQMSDLALALHLIVNRGLDYIPKLLGDFAFVIANVETNTAVAASDIFSLRKLYYARGEEGLSFASRAEALAHGEQYDQQYLAELLAYCVPTPGLTVYSGVSVVPPATIAVFVEGRVRTTRYWSAHTVASDRLQSRPAGELIALCRDLLGAAVRLRLGGGADTWAQLSGGMDSSSVVSLCQWLAEQGTIPAGLAGTVTWVGENGMGVDERDYSDAVCKRFRLRNERIADAGFWHDDGLPLPRTDQPAGSYSLYSRERQLSATVRRGGGRILLTGLGGDQLFIGNMFFFADWVTSGRLRPAVKAMLETSAIGRVSFWELAYKNALLPLLPRALQRHLVRDEAHLPGWIATTMVRRFDLRSRAFAVSSYSGRINHKFIDAVATAIDATSTSTIGSNIDDALDVRHPFLYRPLVEFALQLPPEMCVQPHARKWILREAMRGILPETIRTRVGKALLGGALASSLATSGHRLEALLKDPILGQLGVINARMLQSCFSAARYERDGSNRLSPDVQHALSVEAWLQVRSGRWPRGSVSKV